MQIDIGSILGFISGLQERRLQARQWQQKREFLDAQTKFLQARTKNLAQQITASEAFLKFANQYPEPERSQILAAGPGLLTTLMFGQPPPQAQVSPQKEAALLGPIDVTRPLSQGITAPAPYSGLPRQMAGEQLKMMGIGPDLMNRIIPKMLFGLDVGKPQAYSVTVTPEDITIGKYPPNINRPGEWKVPFDPATNRWWFDKAQFSGYQELIPIKEALPGGGETTKYIPRSQFEGRGKPQIQEESLGGTPYATGRPGFITKIPKQMDLIPYETLNEWYHVETGEHPQGGMTPQQAATANFRHLELDDRKRVVASDQVLTLLDQMENLMPQVFGPAIQPSIALQEDTEAYLRRMKARPGALLMGVKAKTGLSPGAQTLDGLMDGTRSIVVRAIGEKGTLAEGDIKRAQALLMSIWDIPELAWFKYGQIRNLFENIRQHALRGTYRKLGRGGVSGLGKSPMKLQPGQKKDPAGILKELETLRR